MLNKRCMSKFQKILWYLLLHLDMTKYIYIFNILYPIWKYTHKGFPPTPPHPTPCWGRPQRGRGGMGWGGGWGGIPYGYISILDIGYWIYILSSRSCDKYRNIFWIFDMHHFLNMFSWFVLISNVFHLFLRRPKRIVPRFWSESRLNFCVSSVLDPIGDRNDVYILICKWHACPGSYTKF